MKKVEWENEDKAWRQINSRKPPKIISRWSKTHFSEDGKKTLCGHTIPPDACFETESVELLPVDCKICKHLKKMNAKNE